MASKEVTDRSRSTTAAADMLESYADPVQEGAQAVLSGYLQDGETVPDLGLLSKLLGRMIVQRFDALETADSANEDELADDTKPRSDRNHYSESVYRRIVAIRNSISANFGDAGLSTLGLTEPCPRTPDGRARYGRQLINKLGKSDLELPPPITPGISLDRNAVADDLEAHVGPLEAALDSVAKEANEDKGTQVAKDEAMHANDDAFSRATGLGQQVFLLCGLTKLADRIREAPSHPGRLAEPPPPPQPAPATGGGDAATS